MKRILIYIIMSAALAAHAAGLDCHAVARLVTYSAAGDTLGVGYGFFTSPDGEALVPYSLMCGAQRAELIDWKGAAHPVSMILGASSNYDIVRLHCEARKMVFLTLSADSAQVGDGYQVLYYTTNKKAQPEVASVLECVPFNGYSYMTVSTPNEARYMGCPVVNAQGQVVGIVQRNVDRKAQSACAIDARFGRLSITASSALSADFRPLLLPRDIPAEEDDAFSYIYMLHRMSRDTVQFCAAAQLFTQRFPKNVKGYTELATYYGERGEYAAADQAISAALGLKSHEEEVHATLSDIIYQKALYAPEPAYQDWTLERALAESQVAFALRPDTTYLIQQGHCLYGLGRYQEAHDCFLSGANYSKSSAELFYYAANALERAKGDSLQVLALLDRSVESLSRPYNAQAAPYLLARAQHLERLGMYRQAVRDYNEYEKAVGAKNLSDRFYNLRQAAEQNAHMYQQAIDDLHTAATIAANDEDRGYYYLEVVLIYLRSGMPAEARETMEQALRYLPADNADVRQVQDLLQE